MFDDRFVSALATELAAKLIPQIEQGHRIVIGVGDEQQRVVGVQCQRLRTGGSGESGDRLRSGVVGIMHPGYCGRGHNRPGRQ